MAELVYLDLTNIDYTRLVIEVHQIESMNQVGDVCCEIRTKSGAEHQVVESMCDVLERIGKVMAMAEGHY
ncbi:hypothetical protein SEA_SORORFAGO_41 [Mycobacterium phage SororFago]|nr:hypothetical protein SEA_SORORFAGO_41 [Mycobacterium phage SororFago]